MSEDLLELIAHLLKVNRDNFEDCDLEADFFDAFNINVDDFEGLVKALLPLCYIAKSPLTKKVYQGFGTDHMWLMKREVK